MKMEGIELYPHNQKAYDNLCAMLRDSNRACVVQPTGTGKFVIIAKMAQDNPGKNFLLLGTNRGCNQPTAKKVRCAETGNQFVSLSDAARAVGLRNGNSIRRAIDRGGTAGGYHWEYLDEKKEVSTDDHHQADGRAE